MIVCSDTLLGTTLTRPNAHMSSVSEVVCSQLNHSWVSNDAEMCSRLDCFWNDQTTNVCSFKRDKTLNLFFFERSLVWRRLRTYELVRRKKYRYTDSFKCRQSVGNVGIVASVACRGVKLLVEPPAACFRSLLAANSPHPNNCRYERAASYLTGFVELFLQPGHRHLGRTRVTLQLPNKRSVKDRRKVWKAPTDRQTDRQETPQRCSHQSAALQTAAGPEQGQAGRKQAETQPETVFLLKK